MGEAEGGGAGSVSVCGQDVQTTATELNLTGVRADDLAEVLSDATSFTDSIASLTLSSTPIGCPGAVRLMEGAKADVQVTKGVFAVVDGRWGEVTQNLDSDAEVQMRWLDDNTEAKFNGRSYIKTDKLNRVVASRTDLLEDYSHIEQLGKAVTRLTSVDLSKCEFNPSSIASFTRSVSCEDYGVV